MVPSVVPTKTSGFCINQHQFADAKLAEVVAAWDTLPESIKAGLLALIQDAGGQTLRISAQRPPRAQLPMETVRR